MGLALVQTVITDTREQRGIIFPRSLVWHNRFGAPALIRITPINRQLETGDHTLVGYETLITVDMKRQMTEVAANVTTDWVRFKAVLDRMRSFKAAAIALQFPPGHASRPTKHVPNPDRVMDRLYQECYSRGIEVWWCNHLEVINTGKQVLRWLLNRAYLLSPEDRPTLAATNGALAHRRTK